MHYAALDAYVLVRIAAVLSDQARASGNQEKTGEPLDKRGGGIQEAGEAEEEVKGEEPEDGKGFKAIRVLTVSSEFTKSS
jgi:hypothetical protein